MKLIETPTTTSASAAATVPHVQDSTPLTLAPSYLFYITIENVTVAMFTECSGIGAKRDVKPFHEGGVNDHAYVLPGVVEYTNITLKRGLSLSSMLLDWFEAGKYDFAVPRHNITIVQSAPGVTTTGSGITPIKTWTINNAFPVSWKLADLNSSNSGVVIETLEIAHEGISLQKQ